MVRPGNFASNACSGRSRSGPNDDGGAVSLMCTLPGRRSGRHRQVAAVALRDPSSRMQHSTLSTDRQRSRPRPGIKPSVNSDNSSVAIRCGSVERAESKARNPDAHLHARARSSRQPSTFSAPPVPRPSRMSQISDGSGASGQDIPAACVRRNVTGVQVAPAPPGTDVARARIRSVGGFRPSRPRRRLGLRKEGVVHQ